MTRSRSFGAVAESYERYRLGYPEAVVDAVIDYAGRPIRDALEIGAGTGKATRLFAGRGISVTATDPDPAMLAELRGHVPGEVRTVAAAFEQVVPTHPVDLVFAAASLHWTTTEGRAARIAACLVPDGIFACFGGTAGLADPDLDDAVRAARSPWPVEDDVPAPDPNEAPDELPWPGPQLRRSGLFHDIETTTIPRRCSMSASDYVGYLSTVSAYLVLDDADRRAVLTAIRAVLPDSVEVDADVQLLLARRVG